MQDRNEEALNGAMECRDPSCDHGQARRVEIGIPPDNPEIRMWGKSEGLEVRDGGTKIGRVESVTILESGGLKLSVRIFDEKMWQRMTADLLDSVTVGRGE